MAVMTELLGVVNYVLRVNKPIVTSTPIPATIIILRSITKKNLSCFIEVSWSVFLVLVLNVSPFPLSINPYGQTFHGVFGKPKKEFVATAVKSFKKTPKCDLKTE